MAHSNVMVKNFPRSKPFAVATVDVNDPNHNEIVSSHRMEQYAKARQEGREMPIITVELVDHDAPVLPLVNTKPVEKKHDK